jgi:glycosyltransferase involved in cell wall biosynthesis
MSAEVGAGAPRRVLFVVNVGWFFLSHRLALARAAMARGCEVHLACGIEQPWERERIAAEGIVLHELPLRRSSGSAAGALRVMRAVAKMLAEVKPQVVHLVALKVVLLAGLVTRRVPGRRIIAAFSGLGHLFTDEGTKARVARALIMPWFRIALRGESCVALFQNADDLAVFTAAGAVPERRTRLIRGVGVDLSRFDAQAVPEGDADGGTPCVVLPARVLREKGVREFAAAARELRTRGYRWDFVLAGDPDPENPSSLSPEEIARLEQDCGVRALGHVDDIPSLLARASIVCLPSYREGMPKALAEAAAAGRPIVATDVPGCREAVVPGRNGLLVPPRDAGALAAALETLLRDPALRRSMGGESRAIAEERFDERVLISNTLSLYD